METILFNAFSPMLQHQTVTKPPETPWLLHSGGITFAFEIKGKLSALHKVHFTLDCNLLFSSLRIASSTSSLYVHNPISLRTNHTSAVLPAEEHPSSRASAQAWDWEEWVAPCACPPAAGPAADPGEAGSLLWARALIWSSAHDVVGCSQNSRTHP